MRKIFLLIFMLPFTSLFAQYTSYEELCRFSEALDKSSDLVTVETIGKSVSGRSIFAFHFSKSGVGSDKNKIKVLIHAQQHGNEQSGKEGAVLLAKELLKPEYSTLFDKIDLTLVPQVNPDGSEKNERRNANGMDLNRNHLIMTEPEDIALHKLFDKYLYEVTLDAHEYSPYSDEWRELGYRKNSDILIGLCTNPQISASIREMQNKLFLPFWYKSLEGSGVSTGMYSPGGPPEIDYIRYSTFDINDGRQSFGIQNTFSFIQEGMNGEDNYVENLSHRAFSQFSSMLTILKFVGENCGAMKKIVGKERRKLSTPKPGESVALQLDHFPDGRVLELPVYSYRSGKDSIISVKNFRPIVKATQSIEKPYGYLIPLSDDHLIRWARTIGFEEQRIDNLTELVYERISITSVDSINFEGDIIPFPQVAVKQFSGIGLKDYIFVPCGQIKGNMLVIALEPQSELGLATYKQFDYLMRANSEYPIIRVRKK